MKPVVVIAALLAAVIAGGGLWWMSQPSDNASSVAVTMPDLSPMAKLGQATFGKNCAACHGSDAGGTDKGPPLIHKIYEPNHHADYSFLIAVSRGVRSHHWRFGDMPPVEGVTEREVGLILNFVREVQRANGIM